MVGNPLIECVALSVEKIACLKKGSGAPGVLAEEADGRGGQ